ncbi:MAG: hypothetical protein KDA91_01315 [Planctomycetaceae bacterium]|nr:hypothetical protein [Planctomycetaceae bacterium]
MKFFSLFAFSAFLLCGCGGSGRPSLVVVTGKVTLDGKPLEGASIAMKFVSDDPDNKYGRPSRAVSDSSGQFKPAAYGDAEGIPTGKYKVAIYKQEIPEGYNAEDPAANPVNIKWITPRYYSDIDTSGIEIEVTSDGITPETIALQSNGSVEVQNTGQTVDPNAP